MVTVACYTGKYWPRCHDVCGHAHHHGLALYHITVGINFRGWENFVTAKSTTKITVSAVSNTLKKLTTVGSQLIVRRRSRFDDRSRSGKLYYWFILKGSENVLCKLEGEWDRVNLQTDWKLESCYYSTGRDGQQQSANQTIANENHNAHSGTSSPDLPLT